MYNFFLFAVPGHNKKGNKHELELVTEEKMNKTIPKKSSIDKKVISDKKIYSIIILTR